MAPGQARRHRCLTVPWQRSYTLRPAGSARGEVRAEGTVCFLDAPGLTGSGPSSFPLPISKLTISKPQGHPISRHKPLPIP